MTVGWNGCGVVVVQGLLTHCWVLKQQARRMLFGCVVVVVSFGCPASGRRARLGVLDGGVGLLFENCIVDASIL